MKSITMAHNDQKIKIEVNKCTCIDIAEILVALITFTKDTFTEVLDENFATEIMGYIVDAGLTGKKCENLAQLIRGNK